MTSSTLSPTTTPVSSAMMIRAIEDNIREFLLALGRTGGGEERNDPQIQWTIGGAPLAYHNAVMRAQLPPEQIEVEIENSISRFRAQGLPGSWHIGPTMRPDDIGERLLAHNFKQVASDDGVGIALRDLPAEMPLPALATIERVKDTATLDAWAHTLSAGLGDGGREAEWVQTMYLHLGLNDRGPWRHFLARLDGEPVGTASLFLGAAVAGLYFVTTVPSARRLGIATALSHAALREGSARGFRVGIIRAQPPGRGMYRKLGFQQFCQIHLYEWHGGEFGRPGLI